MDNQKVKRVARVVLICWLLFFGYFYELTGGRDLFEYIGFLMIGIYLSFDIKSDLKYLLVFVLTWNVVDEAALFFGDDSFKMLALIPFIVYAVKIIIKQRNLFTSMA